MRVGVNRGSAGLADQIGEIPALAERIDEMAKKWELSQMLTMNINLVLEEALSNIMFYAFKNNGKHEIKISVSLTNKKLIIKIIDNGIPFDPLSLQQPDITLPAEQRPIGGLGVFLISQIMDSMSYTRQMNQNILTLHKNI